VGTRAPNTEAGLWVIKRVISSHSVPPLGSSGWRRHSRILSRLYTVSTSENKTVLFFTTHLKNTIKVQHMPLCSDIRTFCQTAKLDRLLGNMHTHFLLHKVMKTLLNAVAHMNDTVQMRPKNTCSRAKSKMLPPLNQHLLL